MISEMFDVITCSDDDPDSAVVILRCLACDHKFDVSFFILKPKNCEHELGESVTIRCPQCGIGTTVTSKEREIIVLKEELEELQEEIDEYMQGNKFHAILANTETKDVQFKCAACKEVFTSNPQSGLNGSITKGAVVVTCPNCKVNDVNTHDNLTRKLVYAEKIMRVQKIFAQLEKLNNATS